ncbi:isoprenylcysteine carboxylmethyltransferase family protein [Mesorhizobium sp. NBSH29]|uniref:methyltransferase family protein n=1 Tax=Mesorhizobium sp. NBSH29 TaxID=2654249 RepID=UPI001896650C|nr:isoprenylcysteine carboxylmethyltransferase family protein [Mesorhizobium sp. NBSH29]QPC86118.1 isoprenylcysteine carboxylmethyltransferase family protein [Mesorhizobium sp. NBSH29]
MVASTRPETIKTKSADELSRYQRRRRQVLAVLVVFMLMALLFVRSAYAPSDGMHEHIEAFGIGAMVFAILGRTWCTLYIGGRKSSEIVRGGPYSVTRNPLYVFSAIGAGGIGAMSGSLTVAFLLAFLCYIAFHAVILVEEAYLEQNFGAPYKSYMQDVPRFFPNPWLFRESDMLSVRPQTLYRTFTDGLFFLAAYPFFEVIENLQESGFLPVLLHLY